MGPIDQVVSEIKQKYVVRMRGRNLRHAKHLLGSVTLHTKFLLNRPSLFDI